MVAVWIRKVATRLHTAAAWLHMTAAWLHVAAAWLHTAAAWLHTAADGTTGGATTLFWAASKFTHRCLRPNAVFHGNTGRLNPDPNPSPE